MLKLIVKVWFHINQYSVPPEYIGKKLKLQVYDNQLHLYYNTDLVTILEIKNQHLNYHDNHYLSISALTFKNDKYEMIEMAKNNLKVIEWSKNYILMLTFIIYSI